MSLSVKQRTSSGDTGDPVLEELIEQVTNRLQRGEAVDPEALAAGHAGRAERLRQLLPALQVLADLGESAGPGTASGAGMGGPACPDLGVLGDYRLLREVGRGGMGVVYEAEQVSLGRRVALKVLPFAAALDAKQLQRFKNEAQAAAHLHHQHIVPVYAVGCERSVHFYAMQFIDGQTLAAVIHELASRERERPEDGSPPVAHAPGVPATAAPTQPIAGLTTERAPAGPNYCRTVAQLGIQAAEALEHAHQLGVVHRDIKPANLLLEWRAGGVNPPVLWVTDFGLAQVQSQTGLTLSGDLVGTLRYMSPEQALGQRGLIDHRTDVYSLGVTLYELLTLEPAVPGSDRQELLRRLAEEEPRPPRRLNPAVPADLETIVLKALAKEPERRYATAQELADDLRRFLEDKPIRARRPSLTEVAAKWARRHKALVRTAVAAAFAALVLGTAFVWRERRQAEAAFASESALRREAEDNFRLAEQNAQLGFQILDEIYVRVAEERYPRTRRLTDEDRQVLANALRYYVTFARQNQGQPAVAAQAARAHFRAGAIYDLLGQPGEAETAFRQALDLLRHATDDTVHLRLQADCQRGLSNQLAALARLDEALEAHNEAVRLCQELADRAPETAANRLALVDACTNRGLVLIMLQQRTRAESDLRRAVDIAERLTTDHPRNFKGHWALFKARSDLGGLLFTAGQVGPAEAVCRQALEGLQHVPADAPDDADFRRSQANCYDTLGQLLAVSGRRREAEEAHQQAVALMDKLHADFPGVPEHRHYAAVIHHNRAVGLQDKYQYAEAEQAYRAALAIHRQLMQEAPMVPDHRHATAADLDGLGTVLLAIGSFAEAEKALTEAVALVEKLVAEYPSAPRYRQSLATAHASLGQVLGKLGRRPEAEAANRTAITWHKKLAADLPEVSMHHRNLAAAHYDLGVLIARSGRRAEAEKAFRESIGHYEPLAARHPDTALYRHELTLARSRLAELGAGLEKPADARQRLEQEVVHLRAAVQSDPHRFNFREALHNQSFRLADVSLRLGDHAAAARAAAEMPVALPQLWQAYHNAAEMLATCTDLVLRDKRLSEAERGPQARTYADQARATLREGRQRHPEAIDLVNTLAWFLANCPEPTFRSAAEAVELAKAAVEKSPARSAYWLTLAFAHYRAGDFASVGTTLGKYREVLKGSGPYEGLLRAMVLWQQGDKDQARRGYEETIERMTKATKPGQPTDWKLLRIRAEAAALLGVSDPPAPKGQEAPPKKNDSWD